MTQPIGFAPITLLLAFAVVGFAADHAQSPASLAPGGSRSPDSQSASPKTPPAAAPGVRKLVRPPAALKHLSFSARDGFSLRMISNQDVTAEIRNGAGRTLARTAYTLQAGDWTLRPRNLAPGLYTVLLRTGPQLRALRMKIEDSERGKGQPEWVLEKAAVDSSQTQDPAAPRGAFLTPPL